MQVENPIICTKEPLKIMYKQYSASMGGQWLTNRCNAKVPNDLGLGLFRNLYQGAGQGRLLRGGHRVGHTTSYSLKGWRGGQVMEMSTGEHTRAPEVCVLRVKSWLVRLPQVDMALIGIGGRYPDFGEKGN